MMPVLVGLAERIVVDPGPRKLADLDQVDRFKRGDARAFAEVVNTFSPKVAQVISRLGVSPSDVADIVQDVFVDVLDSRNRFRGESSLSTWIIAIAIRRARKHQRWRWVRRWWLSGAERLDEENTPGIDADDPTGRSERATAVRDAIDRLPMPYREVIVLRYLEEMDIPEIADALGISRSATDMRLSRARKLLEGPLKQWWK